MGKFTRAIQTANEIADTLKQKQDESLQRNADEWYGLAGMDVYLCHNGSNRHAVLIVVTARSLNEAREVLQNYLVENNSYYTVEDFEITEVDRAKVSANSFELGGY